MFSFILAKVKTICETAKEIARKFASHRPEEKKTKKNKEKVWRLQKNYVPLHPLTRNEAP